jgi:hypothetical protein
MKKPFNFQFALPGFRSYRLLVTPDSDGPRNRITPEMKLWYLGRHTISLRMISSPTSHPNTLSPRFSLNPALPPFPPPSIKMYLSSLLYLAIPLCLLQSVHASDQAPELRQPVRRYQCASWVPQVECLKSASSFSQMMLTRTMRPKAGMATPAPVARSAAPPPTKNCGGSGMAIMDGQVQGGCVRNRPSPKATPGAAVPTTFATTTRTSSAPKSTDRES